MNASFSHPKPGVADKFSSLVGERIGSSSANSGYVSFESRKIEGTPHRLFTAERTIEPTVTEGLHTLRASGQNPKTSTHHFAILFEEIDQGQFQISIYGQEIFKKTPESFGLRNPQLEELNTDPVVVESITLKMPASSLGQSIETFLDRVNSVLMERLHLIAELGAATDYCNAAVDGILTVRGAQTIGAKGAMRASPSA